MLSIVDARFVEEAQNLSGMIWRLWIRTVSPSKYQPEDPIANAIGRLAMFTGMLDSEHRALSHVVNLWRLG